MTAQQRDQLQQDLLRATAETDTLRAEAAQHAQQRDQLQQHLLRATVEADTLRAEAARHAAEAAQHVQQGDQLQQDLLRATAEADALRAEAACHAVEVAQHVQQRDQLQQDLLRATAEADTLRAEVTRHAAEAAQHVQQRDQLRQDLLRATVEAETLRAEAARHAAEAAPHVQQRDQLQQDLLRATAEADTLRAETARHAAEAARRRDAEELRARAAQSQAEATDAVARAAADESHAAQAEQQRRAAEEARAASERQRTDSSARAAAAELRAAEADRVRAVAEQQCADALAQAQQARSEFWRVSGEKDAILRSSLWRVTKPLRHLIARTPVSVRRPARQAIKLAWWTVSFRLGSKLRTRRQLRRDAQLVVDSALFDPVWYVTRYPDAGAPGIDPLLHYLTTGGAEGRDPGPNFSVAWYRAQCPESAATAINPLVHYLTGGAPDGRETQFRRLQRQLAATETSREHDEAVTHEAERRQKSRPDHHHGRRARHGGAPQETRRAVGSGLATLKILMVGASYPPEGRGGTEVHMHQLARALQARGHGVSVFCRSGDFARPDYVIDRGTHDGVPVARVNYMFRDATSFEWIYHNDRINDLFDKELASSSPDVVHIHHLTCLSTTLIDKIKAREIPLVMTLHDFWMVCPRGQRITADLEICATLDRERCAPCLQKLWPNYRIDAPLLRQVDGELLKSLRGCDRLIAPSQHHRQRMLEIDLEPQRVRVVAHGLDQSVVTKRTEQRWPPRAVGFIGSVIPTKGVHVLIEAVNRIGSPHISCHIHGEAVNFHGDSGYLERLKRLARKDLDFRFHGAYTQADLGGILEALDVLVVPSLWWESFCLTIREAMLAGLPVLASDLGAMREALSPDGEDLLFKAGDAEALAHKLHALATDESRYRRAGELSHLVRGLDDMARDTETVYLEAMRLPMDRALPASPREKKRKGTAEPYATVFVPTWNGGRVFERVLEKVLSQRTDFEYELLIIDSGSRDGTVDFVRSKPGVRLIEISNSEFDHGLTRNRAVREARGEIVVLLTQDAEPYDEQWLEALVDNFDDPDVAGAYCHQVPREDCNPFQRDRLRGWTRGTGNPERRRLVSRERWEHLHPYERYLLIAFDDVASAVRKSVMERIPFEKREFGEDVAWGKQAILSGHTLVMDPRAVVIHSHNRTVFYEFKRVYLDHQNLHDLVGLRTVPTFWLVVKFSFKATFHLWRVVLRDDRGPLSRLQWLLKTPLYAFTQNLAQFLGARSSITHREGWFFSRLDRALRRGV